MNCVATALLLGVLSGAAPAQQATTPERKPEPPSLHGILQRLQENLDQYKARIPSIFSDEHVVSYVAGASGTRLNTTVTDSNFRLKRILNPDDTTTLEESHEVRMVNGRPATGDTVAGPIYLRGAFSNGLALVSLSQQACTQLMLKPIKPKKPYILEFVSVPASERPRDCLLQEDNSGRVLIDPATMQIKRMEFRAPHHLIGPSFNLSSGQGAAPFTGQWNVSVDYAPVLLGSKSYWLPTKISQRMLGSSIMKETSDVLWNEWSYEATYRNFHKLEVTSRILPFDGTIAK
jgi:hypothetical protein